MGFVEEYHSCDKGNGWLRKTTKNKTVYNTTVTEGYPEAVWRQGKNEDTD